MAASSSPSLLAFSPKHNLLKSISSSEFSSSLSPNSREPSPPPHLTQVKTQQISQLSQQQSQFQSQSQFSPIHSSISTSSTPAVTTIKTTSTQETPAAPFIIPTLYIYAILQRVSQPLEKYKYLASSFFNYLLGQLSEPNLPDMIEWMERKLTLSVNSSEIYYLLFYVRIRIADPLFDYSNHHIFRAPSSKHYPRWSHKLKSLAYKHNISPYDLHPNIPIPTDLTPKNQNLTSSKNELSSDVSPKTQSTTLDRVSSLPLIRKKSSYFFDDETPKTLNHTPSLSSIDSTSSSSLSSNPSTSTSTSSSSSSSSLSRLPRMKSTSQQIQQLLNEQKEMNKHVTKLFHSKKLK